MSITQTNRPKRSHVFFLKLALGVFVLIFAAMIFLNQMKAKGIADFLANKPETASPVTAMTVKASEWTPIIETTGLVRPNQGAMLSAQSAGTVSKVLVQNGQSVKKGDLLVELDSSVERASLQAAQAQVVSLRQTYQRYANLAGSGAVSRQELDNAKAAYEAQAANIESLKAAIERRQIVAPFDGKAGIVKVNVGQYVSNGTELVLRFFAMRHLEEFVKLSDFLDAYLIFGNNKIKENADNEEKYRQLFIKEIEKVYKIFGEKAFCIYTKQKSGYKWSSPKNMIFDPLMLAVSNFEIVDENIDADANIKILKEKYISVDETFFDGKRQSKVDIRKRMDFFVDVMAEISGVKYHEQD